MFAPARLRPFATASLILLILFGLLCRFYNLKWDEGAHLHPDERFLTMTVPELDAPRSISDYFDSNVSGLNPFNRKVGFFIYGQLPLNLTKAIAARLPSTNGVPDADNYNDILLVGRFLSALFDSGTVLLIIWLGCQLGGKLLGLLSGALLALVPLHIQQSHFFTVDTFTAFFLTACFCALCYTRQAIEDKKRARRAIIFSGLFFGAACACKISSLMFGAAIVIWALFSYGRRDWKNGLIATGSVLFIAFWAFRVLHPIAFRGEGGILTLFGLLDIRPPRVAIHGEPPYLKEVSFWKSFAEQAAISRGESDPPWNWQWFGHAAYIWPLKNLAFWAIGWPLLLSGVGGMMLAFYKIRRQSIANRQLLVMAFWCLLVFAYYGAQYSKFSRYYLVMTPFFVLLAAWFMLAFVQRYRAVWAYALAALVPVCGTLWCAAVVSIYTRPHTRMEASRWIWANVPPGTKVGTESDWDDRLPIGDARGLEQIDLDLYNLDTRGKRQQMLDKLDQVEWIFTSSNHVFGIVQRAPGRWPLTNEYYRLLFNGELGFRLEQKFTSYPQLFGYQFPDNNIEEALSIYDHPPVYLWRKTPQWSRQRAAQLLPESLCDKANHQPLNEWLK
ncbi:MAG TPA: phospholipid carrier-dependent glycosyltransferase [Abditibacteriaceae bacterium]|jgi:hypothetical protein